VTDASYNGKHLCCLY